MTVLTIAGATLLEARRRRLLVALVLLSALIVVLSSLGFHAVAGIVQDVPRAQRGRLTLDTVVGPLLILVMFGFSGVVALSGVLVSSPSIAAELETGVASAVVARPVRRASVVLGKWLGLTVLVTGYTVVVGGAEFAAVVVTTGYGPDDPVALLLYLGAQGVVVATAALALSTVLSSMTAGIVALILFFVAWCTDIAGGIGIALGNDGLANAGTVSQLIFPSDGLWRGALYAMEPVSLRILAIAAGTVTAGNPALAASGPDPLYLLWCVVWVVGVLGLAVWRFSRRDI